MANNKIGVDYEVNDNGSVDKLKKKTDAAAASTEKLNNKKDTYNKREKGAAQATSNSTKAFSKQAQSIDGGLVPAYATLAANIFAITAAFGVLQRAAGVEQLTKGIAEMGRQSGYAMMSLSKGLQEATGHALSLEEAMRATSMITSAGFDASSVEEIGSAAQKAAVALGRNTQESLERFTRGLVKMEPELLDELGLFVRVDEASAEYARSLGKSANQLTNFEKRQAFANATLAQAQEKFGSVEVETNPYDKLAASFSDLSKTILTAVNTVIIPIIEVLSNNVGAFAGVLGLFASTISQQVLGSLKDYADELKSAAVDQKGLNISSRKNLSSLNKSSKTLKNLTESLKDGSAANREYQEVINGQISSQRMLTAKMDKKTISEQAYKKAMKSSKAVIAEVTAAQLRQRMATAASAEAKTIAALSTGKYSVALKNLNRTFKFYKASVASAAKTTGFFTKTLKIGSVVAKGAATSFRILGAAFSALLGPISLLITLGSLLYEGFMWLRDKFMTEQAKKLRDTLEEIQEPLKEIKANLDEADKGFDSTSKKILSITQANIAYSNSLNSMLAQLQKLEDTGASNAFLEQKKILQDLVRDSRTFGNAYYEEFGTRVIPATKDGVKQALKFAKSQEILSGKVKSIQDAFSGANTAVQNFFNSFKQTSPVTEMSTKVNELFKSLEGKQGNTINKVLAEQFSKSAQLEGLVQAFGGEEGEERAAITARIKALKEEAAAYTGLVESRSSSKELKDFAAVKAGEAMTKAVLLENKLRGEGSELGKSAVANAKEALATADKNYITGKLTVAAKKQELDLEVAKNDTSTNSLMTQINLENTLIDTKVTQNNIMVTFLQSLLKVEALSSEHAFIQATINDLQAQNNTLLETKTEGLEVALKAHNRMLQNLQTEQKYSKMLLDLESRRTAASKTKLELEEKILRAQQKASNRSDVNMGYDATITAAQEAAIQETMLQKKATQLIKERDIKMATLDMEFTLLEQRLRVAQIEATLAAENSTDAEQAGRLRSLAAEIGTATENIGSLKTIAAKQIMDSFSADLLDLGEMFRDAQDDKIKAALAGTQSGSIASRIGSFATLSEKEREALPDSQAIGAYEGMLSPMTEQLGTLGPDGALVQSVVEGAFSVSQAWSTVGEVFSSNASGMAKAAAVAQAVGATIGAVGNIMAEQSNRQIAAIDQQIAAEKKRDGSSAQSLAKISALEKQKEKLERKRFEQQKKVQMASIVANTAAAMIGAVAPPPIGLGFPAGVGLASMYAGMGALQLAVVAGTSYSGGASSSSPSAPTSISVGERGNSTDLASSRSAAGELAYSRGQQGFGGMDNFTPAFTGAKYRAAGGNTAFVVGEQGPEMFVPDRPGTIVPADDTASGMQPTINANINISAVDAEGVEDLLVKQRGNIIGMLREAANANGETFLESVSTMEV